MPTITYNKLIRDRIPEIIDRKGKTATIRILSDPEYLYALEKKLSEELEEYFESGELEELADILEVIRALIAAKGSTWEEVESIRVQKREERGGFEQRIELISVESE